jgi:pimeloyl-ACP methyl ester carboxylesterase
LGAADGSIFTRRTVTIDGISVPCLEGGTAREVESVLYLHGLGGGGKWESFHMAMATVTHTVAPNLPGWSGPGPVESLKSCADYAAFCLKLLQALELPRAVLVGHSIGGAIAAQIAVEAPNLFSRLVLIDPLGLDVPEAPSADLASLDEEAFATAAFAKLGLVARAQPYGFGSELQNIRSGPEFERQWKGRNLIVDHLGGASPHTSLTSQLMTLQVPVMLVWGQEDSIVPVRQGEVLRSRLPDARLQVIEKAAHLPMMERAETTNRVIRDFLVGASEPIEGVLRPS